MALSEHYLFSLFRDFGGHGVRIRRENQLKSSLVDKRAQSGAQGRKMEPVLPEGAKNGAPGAPKLRF